MNILGLHFGHDASVSVIKDNQLVGCLERERIVRLKHAIGLTANDILTTLDAVGCRLEDIDYCAITSTQNIEYIFTDANQLSFEFALDERIPDGHWGRKINIASLGERLTRRVLQLSQEQVDHPYVHRMTDDLKNAQQSQGGIEDFVRVSGWQEGRKLAEIADLILDSPLTDSMGQSMQLPVMLTLQGRKIPGWVMSHHFAHAACAYYLSDFGSASILTQDGSLPRDGYWNGMCYYGKGKQVFPVMPHHLNCGRLYEGVSVLLGLGLEAGPGKMMGLAPYGEPAFFDESFVGNMLDVAALRYPEDAEGFPGWEPDRHDFAQNAWIRHMFKQAKEKKYDLAPLGDTEKILERINIDIAASTQRLLEESLLKCVWVMDAAYRDRKWLSEGLCLSGGVALNCPANSRIFSEGPYSNVFVPPAVHDGGLSIGAALAVLHNTLGEERNVQYGNHVGKTAYLGLSRNDADLEKDLASYREKFSITERADGAKKAAERLARNEVIAIFRGRSEIGPRALGHRSILAHPGFKDNWKLVNRVKHREQWRPLAPAVLEERVRDWFSGVPDVSPFMLFTAKVLNDKIPAVTHVDGSARIQTVNEDEPFFYELLKEFERLTGLPIVMNTSFNGPGEPIVETAEQALRFFENQGLDALFMSKYEICRIRTETGQHL